MDKKSDIANKSISKTAIKTKFDISKTEESSKIDQLSPNDPEKSPSELSPLDKANCNALNSTTDLRNKMFRFACSIALISFILWYCVIFIQILLIIYNKPHLNNASFIAITSGCTVNLFAVLLVIAKGLFSKNNSTK